MLLKIRDYLKCVGLASNQQIAREFQLDLQALQPMLDLWLSKGVIGSHQKKTACQSQCLNCEILIFYQIL